MSFQPTKCPLRQKAAYIGEHKRQTQDEYRMQAMARTRAVNGNFKPNDDYEKMQFYYHPDHLGSSSYITNYDRNKRWKNAKESIYNG